MSMKLLLALVASALAQDWNYDQCHTTKGPSNWPGACKNQRNGGTPIDLCAAKPFPSTVPKIEGTGYDVKRKLALINDGKTVQINIVDNHPRLRAGGLSAIVGRGSNTSTHEWVCAQMHLHWGRTGRTDEGSEHYMQGKRYPLEAHYVHYNAQYDNLTHAVLSGNPETLLVVGVFFEQGSSDVDLMKSIGDNVQKTASKTADVMPGSHELDDLFSFSGNFYSYGGSLTTPTCLEQVTWIVMKEVKPITLQTLNNIKSAQKYDSTELISQYGNYRPIQPLGNRNLYSSNGATNDCTDASHPLFECSPPTQPPTTNPPTNNPASTKPSSNAGSLVGPSALSAFLMVAATTLFSLL